MRRGWILLLVLSLGLNAGLLWRSYAGREGPPPPPPAREGEEGEETAQWRRMAEERHARLADRLGLDPVRRERFLAIRRDALPALVALRLEVRQARHALRGAFAESPFDTQRVRSGLRRLAAAQARVDSLVTAGMLAELGMLEPPEREAYLRAMPWDREPGRGEGRHRPGRGRAERGE